MKDGGPAFPVLHSIDDNWVKEPIPEYCGMSLRDYFAAAALPGCIAGAYTVAARGGIVGPDVVARDSYRCADAMLKAREKYYV